MRRVFIVLFILILTLACRTLLPDVQPTPTAPVPSSTATFTPPPTEPPTATPTPSVPADTSTPTLDASTLPAGTSIPEATLPAGTDFEVRTHPDGNLYVGDLVSLEVIAPTGVKLEDSEVSVQVDPPQGNTIGPREFGPFGIQGRQQATMIWSWDTSMSTAGEHDLRFSIHPQELTFTQTVSLLPASELPSDEARAVWVSTTSECCITWYLTQTAAERDLPELLDQADAVAQAAVDQMGIEFSQPITITILPRLLGHGGFASDEVHVSYLDRNYSTNAWEMVLYHEMIHILDRRLGGELRPSILVEGLAVYQSGGHYKKEDLLPRAAALLEDRLDWYIPLEELTRDFYAAQHEVGYLEAGALIAYMVERWGWEAYSAFYRDIHPQEEGGHNAAINVALLEHFGLSYAALEQDFIAALSAQTDADLWVKDMRLTVTYYDTLRRYQQILDPSAYFRTAWLMDSKEMRRRDNVADYYRHPDQPENIALETMLIAASDDLFAARYQEADAKLKEVNAVLDAIEVNDPQPFSTHALAASYLATVQELSRAGYQVQRISLGDEIVIAQVTTETGGELMQVEFALAESD